MASNLDYRRDYRSEAEFEGDLGYWDKETVRFCRMLEERHAAATKLATNDRHRHLIMKFDLTPGQDVLDKGEYRDQKGDGKVVFSSAVDMRFRVSRQIEIKCSKGKDNRFRPKQDDIFKCVKRNLPYLFFQNITTNPKLVLLKPSDLQKIADTYPPRIFENIYGNKLAYLVPDHTVYPWVSLSDLQPLQTYAEIVEYLME